jgi:hypothetical protein
LNAKILFGVMTAAAEVYKGKGDQKNAAYEFFSVLDALCSKVGYILQL